MAAADRSGPAVLAYDGSELGGQVIDQASRQLAPGREVVVACVWQPSEVGFTPAGGQHFDANSADEVRAAAERTAAHGAALARAAGLDARPLAIENTAPCDGIISAAEQEGASLIVVGARHHGALAAHLLGHVAPKVLARTSASVLVVHEVA